MMRELYIKSPLFQALSSLVLLVTTLAFQRIFRRELDVSKATALSLLLILSLVLILTEFYWIDHQPNFSVLRLLIAPVLLMPLLILCIAATAIFLCWRPAAKYTERLLIATIAILAIAHWLSEAMNYYIINIQ